MKQKLSCLLLVSNIVWLFFNTPMPVLYQLVMVNLVLLAIGAIVLLLSKNSEG